MTDDELEKMGFIKQIQLPSGPIIDLHSEYFIKKDRLKAGVEGAEYLRWFFDDLNRKTNIHKALKNTIGYQDNSFNEAIRNLKIFLGES